MIKTRNIIHKAKPFYRIEYQVFSSILLNILMFEKNETIFKMVVHITMKSLSSRVCVFLKQ